MRELFPRLAVGTFEDLNVIRGWTPVVVAKEWGEWELFPKYLWFPLVDEQGNDPALLLAAVLTAQDLWESGEKVLVVCQQGRSRSVTVAALVLAFRHFVTFKSSLAAIRAVYGQADPGPAMIELAHRVEEERCPTLS